MVVVVVVVVLVVVGECFHLGIVVCLFPLSGIVYVNSKGLWLAKYGYSTSQPMMVVK